MSSQTRPNSSEGFISGLFKTDPAKKADKEASKEAAHQVGILSVITGPFFTDGSQIAAIRHRLSLRNFTADDDQITYAINSKHASGDLDKAFELVVLFQESVEGIVKPYNPSTLMKGAENRGAVTCYLDSVLFAMFARLGSFEPILYTTFDDEPRRRLSTLIRLWVNMLRMGMLIQTDIVCTLG